MKRYGPKHTAPPGGFRYTQPETGVVFNYFTWQEILLYVSQHRLAMGLDTTWDWDRRLEHDWCEQAPHVGCEDDSIPNPEDSPIVVAGRILWGQLHAFTETYPETPTEDDKSNARYWLHDWSQKIPQFGCNCRSEWTRLMANFPPDLSSGPAFVSWSRISHDWVNRKLNKPLHFPNLFNSSPIKDV
jgi:hypothetical protein